MAKGGIGKTVARAKGTADAAADAVKDAPAPSPNPMTNLLIADILLRGSGRLARHAIERSVLGVKYPKDKAKRIIKGRGMGQTLVSTAVARLATSSVPGALVVGGGLLAKALYDRRKGADAARAEGEKAVAERIKRSEQIG